MMKEEWLFPGAVVPVDVETTAALVAEIKRLIDVVGGLILKQGPDFERGFVDGMQKQMQSSVDKAVNLMAEQPAQQEPVAWIEGVEIYWRNAPDLNDWIRQNGQPLYTTPPAQRTWVSLTDKEAFQICVDCGCLSEDWLTLLDAIEAKLKEKNT